MSRLRSGVADYERHVGAIAARRTTRNAALLAFTRAFWWYVWATDAFQGQWVWGKAFGVVPVPIRVRDLRPLFVDLFGEVSHAPVAPPAPAAPPPCRGGTRHPLG